MKKSASEDIIKTILQNKQRVEKLGIARVGVFGSSLHRQTNEINDIDLLIEFRKGQKTFRNLIEFADLMAELFDKQVDVVTPESVSPYILPYITKEIKYV